MWIKPPFLLVIAFFAILIYANSIFYRIWFDSRKFLKSSRKRIYRLPGWYPLKSFYMTLVNDDKGWITGQKIMSIVGEVFFLGFLVLLLTAWVKGK